MAFLLPLLLVAIVSSLTWVVRRRRRAAAALARRAARQVEPDERAFADYARRLTTWGNWLSKDRLVGTDALHGAYARGRFQGALSELRLEEQGEGVFASYEVDLPRPAAGAFEILGGGFTSRSNLSGAREVAARAARQLIRERWGRRFDLTVGGRERTRVRLRRRLSSGADLDGRALRDLFLALVELGEACQGSSLSLIERPGTEILCPYCRAAADDGIVTCTSCRTAHHADCWSEGGGCTLLGCDGLGWQGQREPARGG